MNSPVSGPETEYWKGYVSRRKKEQEGEVRDTVYFRCPASDIFGQALKGRGTENGTG